VIPQVVWKAHAGEKVGVVVNKGGKPTVVEYSEMDTDTTEAVSPFFHSWLSWGGSKRYCGLMVGV
jgi:UDP-N-acetylglucosamine pyrophosphorylase